MQDTHAGTKNLITIEQIVEEINIEKITSIAKLAEHFEVSRTKIERIIDKYDGVKGYIDDLFKENKTPISGFDVMSKAQKLGLKFNTLLSFQYKKHTIFMLNHERFFHYPKGELVELKVKNKSIRWLANGKRCEMRTAKAAWMAQKNTSPIGRIVKIDENEGLHISNLKQEVRPNQLMKEVKNLTNSALNNEQLGAKIRELCR